MSSREKMKAAAEQVVGRTMKKTAHVMGNKTKQAKGAALEARGKARRLKEKGKDKFKR
ncbi:hypothetical protein [Streptomyces katrae]|uniref:hypothetical protein n=1 Tax=Streptomyces katrae TaxID=68223 RepID=UPI0019029491|nr:hypothetical protein [Streptomyces katrae]